MSIRGTTAALSAIATAIGAPPAKAQSAFDRLTVCESLVMQGMLYQRQMRQHGATAEVLKRQLVAPIAAGRPDGDGLWSSQTLAALVDYIARQQSTNVFDWSTPIIRQCEATIPDGSRVTVAGQRSFCGQLSDRAYLIAIDRDRGRTRDQAVAEATMRVRPELRDDVLDVVDQAYQAPRPEARAFGVEVARACFRAPDVIVR